MNPFQVGDLVRLNAGTYPLRVTKVTSNLIWARYEHTDQYVQSERNYVDFQLYSPKEDPMTTLYQTTDGRYGTLLTKDSQGRFVLEIKGSDVVAPFDLSSLKEVIPHTVQIQFEAGGSHHYEFTEGKLTPGDIVVHGANFGRVLRIDTKNRQPRAFEEELRRVVTEAL